MKHYSLLASFVTPSTRNNQSTSSVGTRIINSTIRSLDLLPDNNANAIMEQPSGVYEAVIPQTETLIGMGVIAILCVVLYFVWEKQVVPVSRTKLALSKKKGDVKNYLDQLKASELSSSSSSSSSGLMSETTQIIESVDENSSLLAEGSAMGTNSSTDTDKSGNEIQTKNQPDRAFERWLFNDWLVDNKSEKKAGRQKEPALPILKNAQWNSGDNPVVVAALLMMIGVIFTALTERIASFG
jgi:hypothetical protein